MPKSLFVTRAARRIERRMFLKAMALGASVPVAMRLARVATAATSVGPEALLRVLHAARHGARALRAEDRRRHLRSDQGGHVQPVRPGSDQRQHPGAAAAVQAVGERLPGVSVSRERRHARGDRRLPFGAHQQRRNRVDRHHDAAHDHRSADRQGAQHQAADPGRLFPPDRTAWTTTACCSGTGRPSTRRRARWRRRTRCSRGPAGRPTPSADVQLHSDLLAFTASEIQTHARHADRPDARAEQAGHLLWPRSSRCSPAAR